MTEKIFLKNPYLREIDGRIVSKRYVNNKYYMTLNRTIFYPNLVGGQPRDKGTINGIEVVEVFEENGEIIHVLKDNIYRDKVHLSIDWNNRFDLMQQHTGQHLLSSVFYKLYGAKTLDFNIGHDYVYIDITLKKIDCEIIKRVEEFTNKIIFSNFDIKTYVISKSYIDKLPLSKIPDTDSNIRIVEIDGIDFSPCCGTHHRSTGEIGLIKIRNWERYQENSRIEFVCGSRALKDYSKQTDTIKNISKFLSCEEGNVEGIIKNLYYEKKELEFENNLLKKELSKYKNQNNNKKT